MMRGSTLTIQQSVDFHVEECCNCGVAFAITAEMYKQRQRTKDWFYCPNGHSQHYLGKTDAQLRKEAEAQIQVERDQRLAAERELKRLQARIKGGICPCCNRTFIQLARHMKTKHPSFRPLGGETS